MNRDKFKGTQIRVSKEAHDELLQRSKEDKYAGRGITGVVDEMLFGGFTTRGAGRPVGVKTKRKKSVDK